MRKPITILLLLIHSFNIVGYRLVSCISDSIADDKIQLKVDRKLFDDSELISIKVPFTLPYFSNSPAFESISGNIEVKGVSYEYVKRRFYNDSLEVLCLPNLHQTAINQKKAALAKEINSNDGTSDHSKKSPSNKSVNSAGSDYYADHSFYTYQSFQLPGLMHVTKTQQSQLLNWVTTVEQPPEA